MYCKASYKLVASMLQAWTNLASLLQYVLYKYLNFRLYSYNCLLSYKIKEFLSIRSNRIRNPIYFFLKIFTKLSFHKKLLTKLYELTLNSSFKMAQDFCIEKKIKSLTNLLIFECN